jgi:spore maturation protein CgeB
METKKRLKIAIIGLSITSSWGNGHATTYRSLVKGLHESGHQVIFLERDMPLYANQRDMPELPYGRVHLYNTFEELQEIYCYIVENADCVIVGSYVPEGVKIGHWVQSTAKGITAFYDIDTPITMAKLRNNDYEYLSPDLIPGYHLYLSFTGGPVLRVLENEFKSPKAVPFYCSVDPEGYYPHAGTMKWDLGYMGTYSSARQPGLEKLLMQPAELLSEKRFVVAGPQYPLGIKWPENVARIEHLAPNLHRTFYNSQRFTLNISRDDMKKSGYSPSVRLFEAAACATPIISDYWEGLETVFVPGEEILIAKNKEEVSSILKKMKEPERKNIGIKGYFRVLSQHTSLHRAQQLENYITDVLAFKENRKKMTQVH